MMKLLLTFLFLCIATCAGAQTIPKEVMASGGEAMTDGEIQLNATIGEPLIGTIANEQIIDQGFWAGSLFVEPLTPTETLGGMVVFPNPVENHLNLFTNNNPVYGITLFSIDGRMVRKEKVETAESQHRIDASTLAKGVYVLRVLVEGDTEERLFKVIKR